MTEPIVWRGAKALEPFLVPIDSLEPFPGNPRRGNVEALRKLLRRFGQTKPILVDANRPTLIVAGHHLTLAAKAEGWTHIAPMPHEFENEEEARAFLLGDNRSHDLGSYEAELLLEQLKAVQDLEGTGYDEANIEQLERDLAAARPPSAKADSIPEPPKEPVTKPGELVELGSHRLLCGDATDRSDVERLLAGADVPLLFTSPPYGVGIGYDGYDDSMQNLRLLLLALAKLWGEFVPAGGFCVTNFGDNYAARDLLDESEPCEYPMSLEYWPVFRDAGWLLHTRRVWKKAATWMNDPWTFETNRAAFDWEHVWTWKRPGKALNERREPSWLGVWDTSDQPRDTAKKSAFPAAMPVSIALWILRVYSNRGDVVVDPFAGSGTLAIAADLTGRRALMMEQSPAYCDVIRKRYAEYVDAKENLAWSAERAA